MIFRQSRKIYAAGKHPRTRAPSIHLKIIQNIHTFAWKTIATTFDFENLLGRDGIVGKNLAMELSRRFYYFS